MKFSRGKFRLPGALVLTSLLMTSASCRAAPVRVFAVGDSITDGLDGDTHAESGGWRWMLAKRYAPRQVEWVGSIWDGRYHHEGHNGWTTPHIAHEMAGWVQTAKPDVVLLQTGSNDIRNQADMERALVLLPHIVHDILTTAPKATVYVSALPPCGGDFGPDSDHLRQAFNRALPATLAKSRATLVHVGDKVQWADMGQDHVHPIAVGYAKMAAGWGAIIDAYLKKHPS